MSPGEFVSKCKTKCVQLRLISKMKFSFGPSFTGMNVTVEPSRESKCLSISRILLCEGSFFMLYELSCGPNYSMFG